MLDYSLSSAALAEEWLRSTFSNDLQFITPARSMMLESRETMVNLTRWDYTISRAPMDIMDQALGQLPEPAGMEFRLLP